MTTTNTKPIAEMTGEEALAEFVQRLERRAKLLRSMVNEAGIPATIAAFVDRGIPRKEIEQDLRDAGFYVAHD